MSKNEFAADAFALDHVESKKLLGDALLKLRENSNVIPISHGAFSAVCPLLTLSREIAMQ